MGRYSERCAQAKSFETQKELTPKEKEELEKKQKKETLTKVSLIMRKCETLRTPDEIRLLEQCGDFVKKVTARKERREIYKERVQEKEDPSSVLDLKARKLAEAIRRAKHLICYTGAGISTSARIPDYRGSQGIWTLLAQGKSIGEHDLSLAEPTFTHMALFELHRRKMLRFVVSQNCDGLHLRSGLPRYSLSEVHGNMYVEACKSCKPNVEYWRLFDTTELTARYNHKTNRRCHFCGSPLVDTIVHFGERGSLKWPLNWEGACKQSEKTDCILCLGSSLKVLKKYSFLWAMDRPAKKRPQLFIVNLQWTPKDGVAKLKVNGKCDEVMRRVMKYLDIEVPPYRRERDPIFSHASLLCHEELHTVSQPMLKPSLEEDEHHEENSRGEAEEDAENSNASNWGKDTEEQRKVANGSKEEEVKEKTIRKSPVDVVELQKRLNRFEEEFKIVDGVKEEPMEVAEDRLKDEDRKIKSEPTETPEEFNNFQPVDYLSRFLEKKRELELFLPSTSKGFRGSSFQTKQEDEEEENQEEPSRTETKISEAIKTLYKFEPPSLADVVDETAWTSQTELERIEEVQRRSSGFFLGSQSSSSTSDAYYEDLLRIYQSLESTLPHWNNPKYAYSGLHSIIHPPPPELNIWGSVVIPILQQKVVERPPPPECAFCFENYAELKCQFYEPQKTVFQKVSERNGRAIVCECCDHSDEEEEGEENGKNSGIDDEGEESREETRLGPVLKEPEEGEDDDEEEELEEQEQQRRRKSNELNEISNNLNRNGEEPETPPPGKLAKLGQEGADQKENGTGSVKVQAGWYGKGYRKYRQRRRKS